MPAQLLERPERSTTRGRSANDSDLGPRTTVNHPLGNNSDDPERTRRIEVAKCDAIGDLRESDPATADKVEAAFAEIPAIGGEYEGFQLVHLLGEGAFGRVFMAKQNALAGRLVALKICADLNAESQRLAQLQHTNIMPIYSEHRSGHLHAVCMPYFGCTTLADVVKALRSNKSLPTSGKHLVSTLFNRQSTLREGDKSSRFSKSTGGIDNNRRLETLPAHVLPTTPAVLDNIERMSYVDAVLWIGARLANGLAHAHERGIIHRDLKPANVLIADDGQPLLLDFNLAEDVKLRCSVAVAQVGGTLPYMSPEQLIAYRDGFGSVDARGDIYALGLILYHLLSGEHAFPVRKGNARTIVPLMIKDREGAIPPMRPKNRNISPAVEAIVLRCLAADPAKRYQSASEVAEDIERHRANLPLKHTPEPSLIERGLKWSRRHPKFASPTTFSFLAAAFMLLAVTVGVQRSLERKHRDLEERRVVALERFHDFGNLFEQSQDLLTSDDPAQLAEGTRIAETALRDYGVLDRSDWMEQPAVKELAPSDRERLKAQVGEMAFLLARTAYFQSREGFDPLQWNQLASANLDDSSAQLVELQRTDLSAAANDVGVSKQLRDKLETADGLKGKARFFAACQSIAMGQVRAALVILKDAVREDPRDFGCWLLKGRCHHLLRETADADAAYATAIALRPTHVRVYLWRAALLQTAGENLDQAKASLDVALKLQPNLLDAYIDRGLVLHAQGKSKQALEDLDWALGCPGVPSRVWFIRSIVKTAIGDKDGAAKDMARGMKVEPTDPISWASRGYARLGEDPKAALSDFIKAEELAPRYYEAIFNQACVLGSQLKKYDEAIAVLDRLLKKYPDDLNAMSSRAIYLMRAGKEDEAVAAARACLKMNPTAQVQYRVACVLAMASSKKPELRQESMKLLAWSSIRGWNLRSLETDKDLKPLHDMPEYQKLVEFVRVMNGFTMPKTLQ